MKRASFALGPIAAMLLVWELVARFELVPSYTLPPLTDVVSRCFTDASYLGEHSLISAQEIAIAFVLSAVIGVLLGVAIVSARAFEKAVFPLLVCSQVVPKIALAPLLIIWLGFGISSKVVIAFLIAFFPVVVSTVTGFRAGAADTMYLARSMGATRLQLFFKVRLPAALPSIFDGLKVSATLALSGAIIGEYAGADQGIGYVISQASAARGGGEQVTIVFAAVLYITAMGLLLYGAVVLAERITLRWEFERRRHRRAQTRVARARAAAAA
jgi:NitT/TauT family transport system permease protein